MCLNFLLCLVVDTFLTLTQQSLIIKTVYDSSSIEARGRCHSTTACMGGIEIVHVWYVSIAVQIVCLIQIHSEIPNNVSSVYVMASFLLHTYNGSCWLFTF